MFTSSFELFLFLPPTFHSIHINPSPSLCDIWLKQSDKFRLPSACVCDSRLNTFNPVKLLFSSLVILEQNETWRPSSSKRQASEKTQASRKFSCSSFYDFFLFQPSLLASLTCCHWVQHEANRAGASTDFRRVVITNYHLFCNSKNHFAFLGREKAHFSSTENKNVLLEILSSELLNVSFPEHNQFIL